ncbi:hypothetical protein WICANDRAFT_92008 [Wickerhamomyces anomalus NRRL Y-366-8]|uniref:Uncharacterized protein n=1 Tax=Wickerhamomyces anomalus (strain ATCC 58044 / CBS 1984 / NCYC 433 / NRRL Y-366-8) TaxID=683960 RepID=A0A1E3P3W0_WICAA|nr:uncharacterized protein WICANDRAFT_92008 [Wickerhamomyces anomalus NRRL Y-366-8]ODQ59930.1 hypothetical protein WICANDRAFT_92008 [Wickerhamomyces anomalus NRRL Y-366-8]
MVLCFVVHCWFYDTKAKIVVFCTVFVVAYRNLLCFAFVVMYTKMNYLGE